jgi:hypothetical protein
MIKLDQGKPDIAITKTKLFESHGIVTDRKIRTDVFSRQKDSYSRIPKHIVSMDRMKDIICIMVQCNLKVIFVVNELQDFFHELFTGVNYSDTLDWFYHAECQII